MTIECKWHSRSRISHLDGSFVHVARLIAEMMRQVLNIRVSFSSRGTHPALAFPHHTIYIWTNSLPACLPYSRSRTWISFYVAHIHKYGKVEDVWLSNTSYC